MTRSIALLFLFTTLVKHTNGFSTVSPSFRPRPRALKNLPPTSTTTRFSPRCLVRLNAASSDDDDDKTDDATSSDEASSESDDVEESDDEKPTFRQRLRKLWVKDEDDGLTTRQRLAKMGLAAVLSYGWVSNVSYAVCISIAWYGFSKKTKLSPLAPDQWKPFLAVYAGFFVFNNVVRPFRLGLSIAISRYFDDVIAWVERKTKFSRSISIALVVFLFNIVGTISLMTLGISLASLASGVPIFPPKS